uniref:Uncharacterized protein n=1 Tax=Arundo donax TaxID=35708 RepID=A0A0A8Z6P5_ARUDO
MRTPCMLLYPALVCACNSYLIATCQLAIMC